MRFLLINPYCPLSETPTPPLGLAFVAAALERAGVEVRILDLVTYRYEPARLEALLASFRPEIVGATAVTMTFNDAARVIRDVKRIDPDILTVMGGPHVTFSARETLSSFPELDLIVLGEGEATVAELVAAADGARDWSRVLGLAYRDGGEIRSTGMRPHLDVDTLPVPARHLLPLGRYRALNLSISMTTSRGCPFPCIFCVGSKMVGAKIRYRNTRAVVDEMEYLAGLGFPQINVADDLFTAKKSHANAVCDEIMRRGLQVKWSCFSRVDTCSPAILKKMRAAGCATVSFGVETANIEILKTVRKGIKLPQVTEAVKMCVAAGIDPHVSFILGLPGETPETLDETQKFGERIMELGGSYGFHLLAPFPGTAVRDKNEDYDLTILTNDWSRYHANRAIVATEAVTADMLNAVVDRWNQQCMAGLNNGTLPGMDNLKRILVFYELMMNRAIEENGWWKNGTAPVPSAEALEVLARRVHDRTSRPVDETCRALSYAHEHGHLTYRQDGDTLRWRWTDYIAA